MPEISLFNDLKRHSILCEVLFLCLFHIQLCNVQGAEELSLTLLWITIFFEKKKRIFHDSDCISSGIWISKIQNPEESKGSMNTGNVYSFPQILELLFLGDSIALRLSFPCHCLCSGDALILSSMTCHWLYLNSLSLSSYFKLLLF